MRSLTELSTRRPLSTAALVLVVLVLGSYSLTQLPVDFLPSVTYPLIKVHIWWRGATPDQIDRQIADPVEREMSTVDGLDYLESSSIEGMYTLQANFRYGTDVDVAYQDALAAMARVARELPGDIEPPIVIKADPSQLPVMQLTVRSDRWDLVQLREWVDNWLRDELVAVPGVAGTEVVGGLEREIRVLLDPLALERHHLGVGQIVERLAQENVELAAGRVTAGPRELIARTTGEFQSLDEIRDVVLSRSGEARLRLGDVATVADAHEEVRVITRLGGQPCVKLSVLKQADANTVAVARAAEARLDELGAAIPAGIELGVVENQADYVEDALHGVRSTALEAVILIVVIMALFLGDWRQVVAMSWALPFTLIGNFAWMHLAGFSFNIFSLGGIVIAIAVDLDNSIIVIENITRLRREHPQWDTARLVVQAVREVASSVTASTLSFLALFLPFLLVPGLTSLLFRELVLVIAGIMSLSLLNAMAITPVVMALLLRRAPVATRRSRFEHLVERTAGAYGRLLGRSLRHRLAVGVVFAVLLGAAVASLGGLGSEFLPRMDDGRVMVKVRLPTGASLAQTDAAIAAVEQAVAGDPLVDSAFALVGGKVWGLYTYEIANEGELDLQLVPRGERASTTSEYIEELRQRLRRVKLPAGKAMVKQMKVKGIRSTGTSDIDVRIRGTEMDALFDLARQAHATMSRAPYLDNTLLTMDMTKPELQVHIDRVRAIEQGLTVAQVATTLQALVRGAVASRYREGDEYYDIRVMVPEDRITGRSVVQQLPMRCSDGGCIRLDDVADVAAAVGPVEIQREDQVKQVVVSADAVGTSVGEALDRLRDDLGSLDLPPGYEITYGGQAQMMAEARRDLLIVLGFALFFAGVILTVQFNRLRAPGIIFATLPFSLAGIALALALTRTPIGSTVLIGLLVVVAIHITESVLVLTYADEAVRRGMRPADAAVAAATTRFRPRIMAGVAVVAGLLPLALNLHAGGDLLQPMAIAAIGGVVAAILVGLFLVPMVYSLRRDRGGETPAPAEDR